MSFDAAISRIAEIQQSINAVALGPSASMGVLGSSAMTAGASGAAGAATAQASALASSALPGADSASGADFSQLINQLAQTDKASGASGVNGSAQSNSVGQRIVDEAKTWLGVPYVWGGNTRKGVDCSGLVKNVMATFGVSMPRTAHEQMLKGESVPSLSQARPGDLVVFKGGKHIGIYVGDGKMIDAPKPGGHVNLRDVFETPTAIRRVTGLVPAEKVQQTSSAYAGVSALMGSLGGVSDLGSLNSLGSLGGIDASGLAAQQRAAFTSLISSSLVGSDA